MTRTQGFALLIGSLIALAMGPALAQPAFPQGVTDSSFSEPDGDRVIQMSVLAPASVDRVWSALTTAAGWRGHMGVGFAEVDLRIGGLIETSYSAETSAGSSANIRNEIVAYVPERLLVIRNVQAPPGFRHAPEFAQTVTLLELSPEGEGTRVTLTALAFPRTGPFDDLYTRFHFGDAYTLAVLRDSFSAD